MHAWNKQTYTNNNHDHKELRVSFNGLVYESAC